MALPKRIMIIAWGSRGDMQPVTALALSLKKLGREVLVFGTPPATDLIIENGIDCVTAQENITEFVESLFGQVDLSDRSIKGLFKLAKFGKEYLSSPEYITTQKADMNSAFNAAQHFKPDLLITPNIIYGSYMSMAEALKIPVITFDLQINHPTSHYPLFTMEVDKFPNFFNPLLYKIKSWLYPKVMKPKFDMMREIFGLPLDSYADGSPLKVWPHDLPQICAVSPSLCPQPVDWPAQKLMGGWWFLSKASNFTPSPDLVDFLQYKPVYIGFGSMKGNPEFCRVLSTLAIKSLQLCGHKGILLGGWAGLTRETLDTSTEEGKRLYAWAESNILEIDSCPHDWLFPQCAAVVHHGGAGTLAAGIRAGSPTIVCAMQGDQPFHGSLVQTQGIGKYMGMIGSPKLTADSIATAIKSVTTDKDIITAAKAMSFQVQSEDGLENAISFIDHMVTTFSYPWAIKSESGV